MQFSSFTRTTFGLTILFKNSTPIINVGSLKFYSDNSSGLFSKKEFRWSFDNSYWSSWSTLNQGNISSIQSNSNTYLYLEVKYTLTAVGSGTITSFILNYSTTINNDPCATTNTVVTIPDSTSNTIIIENKCTYGNIVTLTNADLLNNKDSNYYLNRGNHKGTQPISSITNLQTTLNNILNTYQNSIQNSFNVDGSGIGVLFNQDGSTIYFKNLYADSSSDIIISEDANGIITFSRDLSLTRDPSINILYRIKLNESSIGNDFFFDASGFLDISTNFPNIFYIDGSLNTRDISINYLNINKTSFIYVDGSLNIRDVSIAWLNTNKADKTYVDGSLNLKADKTYVDGSLNLKADKTYVDGSLNIRDVSINNINQHTLSIDSSITNFKIYIDNSLNIRDISINKLDASLNLIYPIVFNNETSIGIITNRINNIDSSIINLKTYVDGSLDNRDISINNINQHTISIDVSIINLKTYVDGSLLYRDTSINYLNLNKAPIVDPNFTNSIEWSGGNIIYVPLTGNIQTYVNDAFAGDTLVLSSGVYNITSSIIIDKQLNIIGQGNSGFVTSPITPSHGTLISSSTSAIVAFQIDNDNIRISNLSINLSGSASIAINTANNLQGIVLSNIDIIVICNGMAQGFTIYGSDAVLRDLTFYVKSLNNGSSGLWIWNDQYTNKNTIVDCFNVTGTVQGGSTYAYAFVCENIDDSSTLTLNLSNSVCRALPGTPLDIAVASISTTTNNSIVNAYLCTFDGDDYDIYQSGTNQLNLGGSVVVNNKIFGTPTYRATMVSGIVQTPLLNGGILDNDDITIQGTTSSTKTTSYVNIQPTGGKVGIGTITPLYTLDVSGNANVKSDFIVDSCVFYVNSLTHKVGIKTLDPSYNLDVSGLVNIGTPRMGGTTSAPVDKLTITDGGIMITSPVDGGNGYNIPLRLAFGNNNNTAYHELLSNRGSGEFRIWSGAGGNGHFITFWSDNVESMRCKGGKMGIGTTNPLYSLDVSGKIGINNNQFIYLPDQSTFIGTMFIGNGGNSISDATTGAGCYNTYVGIGSGLNTNIANYNTALGRNALMSATSGFNNTAIGNDALKMGTGNGTIISDGSGAQFYANTAVGQASMRETTLGSYNTAIGVGSLVNNTLGKNNTAIGVHASNNNIDGDYNVAIGYAALYTATTVDDNVAIGYATLEYTTTGKNTAVGSQALMNQTTGDSNCAYGYRASLNLVGGLRNVAVGYESCRNNVSGAGNSAFGFGALYATLGSYNTGIGYNAGDNISNGNYNIIIGYNIDAANAAGSYQLNIGNLITGNMTSGSKILTVDGSLGIKTLNPLYTLDVSGNFHTTGSTTIDGSLYVTSFSNLNALLTPNSSTATEVRFDQIQGYVYGTTTSPITGDLTMSASDAILGVTDLIISKKTIEPTYPVTFKKLSGVYDVCTNINNFIYVQYLDPSTQVYTINQIKL